MKIHTVRFGEVAIESQDVLQCKNGLVGYEDCNEWVILADAENAAVAWLQSLQRPELAMPVVSPRRFVPDYQIRIEEEQLESLELSSVDSAHVLCLVGKNADHLTVNLRAPLIVNLEKRLASQVITFDDQPLQHELASLPVNLRRSA